MSLPTNNTLPWPKLNKNCPHLLPVLIVAVPLVEQFFGLLVTGDSRLPQFVNATIVDRQLQVFSVFLHRRSPSFWNEILNLQMHFKHHFQRISLSLLNSRMQFFCWDKLTQSTRNKVSKSGFSFRQKARTGTTFTALAPKWTELGRVWARRTDTRQMQKGTIGNLKKEAYSSETGGENRSRDRQRKPKTLKLESEQTKGLNKIKVV